MKELTEKLQRAEATGSFADLRTAAKEWAAWALENLRGETLRRALEISIALCAMADLDDPPTPGSNR